jgi:transposase
LACVEFANAYSLLEPTEIVARERVLEVASKAIEKILAEYGIDLTKPPCPS